MHVCQPLLWLSFVRPKEQPLWERAGESGNETDKEGSHFVFAIISQFCINSGTNSH